MFGQELSTEQFRYNSTLKDVSPKHTEF